MKPLTMAAAGAAMLAALPALAQEVLTRPAEGSVAEAMDRLEQAVRGAGATVFARVDHGAGAESVQMELPDAQLLIFGNPQLGTPVMQADSRAGLLLPLKILVYEDADGVTQVAYRPVAEVFDGLDVPADLEVLGKMEGALEKFAGAAAGG